MKKVGASDTELAPICVWLPKKTRPFQVSKEVRISMRRLSAKAMETLFIITVDIDVNDSTRLVRFFYGIYLLVIIVPKNEGTSHPSITSTILQPYILILTPAQIQLLKQYVLFGPTPNRLTQPQRNTLTH